MSKDFQLAWSCPHITMEESVVLGSDRRSLETRQPASSVTTVRVIANNELYIPSAGLYSVAQIKGAMSGPFNIIANETTLTVQGSTETHTFTLPTGTRVSTNRLVDLMRPSFTDIVIENINGHLVFSDAATVGQDSRLFVTGTAAAAVGFQYQMGSRGRRVYPPWTLAQRPDTITNRYPQFLDRVKGNPTFKVTYAVVGHRCLRCRATYVENDYRHDRTGDAILIENENLLYQAALKILLTEKGSNPYHTWYGSRLLSRIGTKAVGAVTTLITEDVRTALDNMQTLQRQQARFQSVSAKERLYSVLSVEVKAHESDPTMFLVEVVVQNASGEPVSLSVVFTVPGAYALQGSNNQSLGLSGLTADQIRQLGG